MFDIVSWGLAVSFVLKPVVEELAKDATKDWIKDMFKGSLSKFKLLGKGFHRGRYFTL